MLLRIFAEHNRLPSPMFMRQSMSYGGESSKGPVRDATLPRPPYPFSSSNWFPRSHSPRMNGLMSFGLIQYVRRIMPIAQEHGNL